MTIGFESGFGEIASILFGGTFNSPIDVLFCKDRWQRAVVSHSFIGYETPTNK